MREISLCMVLKDAAITLPRCLKSMDGLYDELVCVVDDNCADDTLVVARSAGASYAQAVPFPDSFAVLRNLAIARATREFVLSIDDDETATDAARTFLQEFRTEKHDPDVGYCPTYKCPMTGGIVCGVRLFRRAAAIWKYRAHEQVCRTDGSFYIPAFAPDEFLLLHPDPNPSPAYHERCIRLTRLDCADKPADPIPPVRLGLAMLHRDMRSVEGYKILRDAAANLPARLSFGRTAYSVLLDCTELQARELSGSKAAKPVLKRMVSLGREAQAKGYDGAWVRSFIADALVALGKSQEAMNELTVADKLPWDRHGNRDAILHKCHAVWLRAKGITARASR